MDRAKVKTALALTDDHVLLFGPRGVAKTTTAVEAARPGQVVFQTTFTAEASAAQYLGHFVPKGNEFVWHKGPFQRAWEEGGLLVINEIDHASEDVSNLLHALLDGGLGAYLTLPTGETIHPAPGFRTIATMNGIPSDLHHAVLDRFSTRIPVTMPSEGQLASLPPAVAETCRMLYQRGQHEKTTFRMLQSFSRHVVKLTASGMSKGDAEDMAAEMIYGDEESAKALLKAIRLNEAALAKTASGAAS